MPPSNSNLQIRRAWGMDLAGPHLVFLLNMLIKLGLCQRLPLEAGLLPLPPQLPHPLTARDAHLPRVRHGNPHLILAPVRAHYLFLYLHLYILSLSLSHSPPPPLSVPLNLSLSLALSPTLNLSEYLAWPLEGTKRCELKSGIFHQGTVTGWRRVELRFRV